ncbi:hypothetical protein DYB32_007073 [Aphanomyces invadans]|uniref:Histone-lysine N-methyltransferase n=1 Tax=Aphanomyces invadans TaxID=157072 RepID=A0A3R6Z0X4_9STRA|nr:hypothetical protein DYB32_007073 [Aphanomyces invadans]
MAYCFSQHINVFVRLYDVDNDKGWWPAQLMSLSGVAAQHLQGGNKKLVYLYGANNLCAWVSMSGVRSFDVFEVEASQLTNAMWVDAVDDAKEEVHLARETVVDAKETLRRDIQKRLHGKKWVGKKVEVMNFSEHSMTHGTITQFNPATQEYCLESERSSRWFIVNDDVHISLLVDCSYAELSMQWFSDPDAVLHEVEAPQQVEKSTPDVEADATRCVKCLFPLAGEVLLPCAKCAQLFHQPCVDCPQDAYPLVDPMDGALLIDDIGPAFVCPSCLVCDGCEGVTTSDKWHRWKLPLGPVTLCTACHEQYVAQMFCPVCHRVYEDGMAFCCDVMQCTTCDLWVHSTCEPDPDPLYHGDDPQVVFENADDNATTSITTANPSTTEQPDAAPLIAPSSGVEIEDLSDKQRRRVQDDKAARALMFPSTYDPRILSKYECFTCRRIRCFRLLKALVAEDKLGLFREPVTVDIAPTYFDVIKSPMDLRTMEDNLKDQRYVHALCADFRDHFELMCLNAVTFNSKEHHFAIWREAWRFYNAGLRLMRQNMPSVALVTGTYAENMIAAAKRQLPNNSVLANKEEPKKDVVMIPDDSIVESKQPATADSTTNDLIKAEPSLPQTSAAVVTEDVVKSTIEKVTETTFIVPTELGTVPKPYSCMSSVVVTQSKMQAHETAWIDMCVVCCSSGQPQSMIFCVDCGEVFHTFCLQPALDILEHTKHNDKILEYWRCPNCKICEFCGRCNQEDEAKLLVCDVCERGFHTFCLKPRLREVPSGGFVCGSCVQCETCSVTQEITAWSPNPSSCLTCLGIKVDELSKKKPAKRSTDCCPVCTKKWIEKEPLIQCDGCELWVHPVCDSITDESLEVLVEDPTSEYYCPVCRQKQRQHLNVYKKAWDLQMTIAQIQNTRQDIVETWRAKQECLKSLAGRRVSFTLTNSQGGLINAALIPAGIRRRACRYMRFKRYARGPKAALRRQNRKKGNFFSWEGVKAHESAIANVVSEAVSAASFLACCAWLYGTKKLSHFAANLLRSGGEPIPDALWNALIDKNALSIDDEVKFLVSEYNKRAKARDTAETAGSPDTASAPGTPTPSSDVQAPAEPSSSLPPTSPEKEPAVEEVVLSINQVHLTFVKPLQGWELWPDHVNHLGAFEDHRVCGFCRGCGDSSVCGRLIFADYDQWVHVNCAFWSHEVFEDAYGTLIMCQKARFRGRTTRCSVCNINGATVGCHGLRCPLNFHFTCAQGQVDFTLEKQSFCNQNDHWMAHIRKKNERRRKKEDELEAKRKAKLATAIAGAARIDDDMDNPENAVVEKLESPEVDEVHQCVEELVSTICSEAIDARLEPLRFLMCDPITDRKTSKTQMTKGTCYRIGALCVQNLGAIEVGNHHFHTRSAIYPVGYRSTRIFWSATRIEHRALYECEIFSETNKMAVKRPIFKITPCDDLENPIFGVTPNDAVDKLRGRVLALYSSHRAFKAGWNPLENRTSWYSFGLVGEHFFGVSIPAVAAAIESLPYAPTTALQDSKNPYPYVFCHNLPTPAMFEDAKHDVKRHRVANEHAKHSSGCARTDGYSWHKLKGKPDLSKKRKVNVSKQASTDDSNAKPIVANGMENLPIPMQYRDLRRRPFCERLEVRKSKIHGYGLFVKEAIAEGKMIVEYQGQAIRQKVADMREKRYANARIISIDGNEKKIIIFAKVALQPGDEVTYDYKFPIEDEALRCDCGAPNCIGRMN